MRFFKDYLDNEFSDKSTLLKRVKEEGFEMDHDPIGDGMCFYASAGHQLGLSAMTVQNILFDYLRNQRYDVRIYQPNLWLVCGLGSQEDGKGRVEEEKEERYGT